MDLPSDGDVTELLPWPSEMKERALALQQVMSQTDRALTVEEVAQHFYNARRDDVKGLLETLKALRIVEEIKEGVYAT